MCEEKFTQEPSDKVNLMDYMIAKICDSISTIETKDERMKKDLQTIRSVIKAAPDMYKALKMVCEDCEKLSNWEDMFNIGRPEGSIMPKCPCDECYVKEALMKADGEAFQEVKKRRRIADIAFEMYELLDHIEDVLDDSSGCGEISVEEIRKVLKKARGEE